VAAGGRASVRRAVAADPMALRLGPPAAGHVGPVSAAVARTVDRMNSLVNAFRDTINYRMRSTLLGVGGGRYAEKLHKYNSRYFLAHAGPLGRSHPDRTTPSESTTSAKYRTNTALRGRTSGAVRSVRANAPAAPVPLPSSPVNLRRSIAGRS
jgi:hypothetical protein